MGTQLMGTYEGEGPNVAAPLNATNIADVQGTGPNPTTTGQGKTAAISIDRRRRVRTSSESARSAIAINFSSDQVFTKATRGLHVSTAGTLAVRFADDAADVTLVLAIGVYPYAISVIRNSGSSGVVGVALF